MTNAKPMKSARELIQLLEPLEKAATPGPWQYREYRVFNCEPDIRLIAYARGLNNRERTPEDKANARLIAELRTHLPDLLRHLNEAEKAELGPEYLTRPPASAAHRLAVQQQGEIADMSRQLADYKGQVEALQKKLEELNSALLLQTGISNALREQQIDG